MSVTVRPLRESDVAAAVDVQVAAFTAYDRALGHEVEVVDDTMRRRFERRVAHLFAHDPAGSWVADGDDGVVGVALALQREGLWGLSLLAVSPETQSAGLGRRLLDAALGYAEGCDHAVILSSQDPRAIRLYATSGFELHPQMKATGRPDPVVIPALGRVRDGSVDDVERADGVDREVRRAARGPDHVLLVESSTMFVVDDEAGRGYAYWRGAELGALAATDERTAADLLWRGLAHADELGESVTVQDLNARQQWAMRVALRARLTVKAAGPVFWRNADPPAAYLPSGAFL